MKILSKDMNAVLKAVQTAGKDMLNNSQKAITAEADKYKAGEQSACKTACNLASEVGDTITSETQKAWKKKPVQRLCRDIGVPFRIAKDLALETAQHGACQAVNLLTDKTSAAKTGVKETVTKVESAITDAAQTLRTDVAKTLIDISLKISTPKRNPSQKTAAKGPQQDGPHN